MADDTIRYQKLYEMAINDAFPAHVEFAADGAEALAKLDATQPHDLMILDLNMPHVNGEEVLRRIRQDPGFDRMPVIILTGDGDIEKHQRLLDIGADDFIEKGSSPDLFVARLKTQMRHKTALDRLTELALDMDLFAAGVLHDIRNVESTISSLCHLAAAQIEEDPVMHRDSVLADLESLEAKAKNLGGYAREIITMVRDSSESRLNLQAVAVAPLLDWATGVLAGKETTSGAQTVRWSAPKPLAALTADPNFLKLALFNIVQNSVKYSRPGIPTALTVTQAPSQRAMAQIGAGGKSYVTTFIRDNGMGIKPEDLRTVFEPFRRGSAKSQSVSGFGLGLALVSKVIRTMGGAVWAQLPPDHEPGAVLCIDLPAAPNPSPSADE